MTICPVVPHSYMRTDGHDKDNILFSRLTGRRLKMLQVHRLYILRIYITYPKNMAFLRYTMSPSSSNAEESYTIGPLIKITFMQWAQLCRRFPPCHIDNKIMHHLRCLCSRQPVHWSWVSWVQLTATYLISLILISMYHHLGKGNRFPLLQSDHTVSETHPSSNTIGTDSILPK
jgi:hypothetical protein